MLFKFQNTHKNDNRIIFHIDFDYFFAQCEEIRDPSIRARPVVVCVYSGRTIDSGVVSTSNYIARAYGTRSGMSIKEAKSKLHSAKDAVFLPIDLDFYSQVSNTAMDIIKSVTSKFEIIGLDECYLDMTTILDGNYKGAILTAKNLKQDLAQKTNLICSVGISYNKLLAKIASRYKKPNGLYTIDKEEGISIISDFDIGIIPGIGPKNKKRLNEMGIIYFKQLAQMDIDFLRKEFGYNSAQYFHDSSLGINYEPVKLEHELKQIVRIKTLKKDSNELEYLKLTLNAICQVVYDIAYQKQVSFKNVSLLFITNKMEIKTRSKTLKNYSQQFNILYYSAELLLFDYFSSPDFEDLRRIGVRISDFKTSLGQNTLLDFIK